MAETVAERVIRLETQITTVASEIAEVKGLIKEIIVKVDNYGSLQADVRTLKDEISQLKQKAILHGLIFPTIAAGAGAVLALLISSYLGHLH